MADWLIYIGLGGCGLGFLYLGLPWMYGRWLRVSLNNKAVRSKTLVLTFDDGPGSRLTPAILDILSAHNVKATFFLLGRNIAGRESIVKRIQEEGHEICCHGYDHINYWKVFPCRALSDMKKGREAISGVIGTGESAYPFRPPYGKLNLISLLYLWIHRLPVCYWTLVSGDTWPAEKRDVERVAAVVAKVGGVVSLAHDFDREDDSVDDFVLKSLKAALDMAEQSGMRVRTMSELMSH